MFTVQVITYNITYRNSQPKLGDSFLERFKFYQQEEVQKLAAQIEFMKIVQMEMHNRHLRPRPGGYFSSNNTAQSPMHAKTVNISMVNHLCILGHFCK